MDGFRAIREIQFGDNAIGYGNIRISGIDVRAGTGQHYESDYLAVAGA